MDIVTTGHDVADARLHRTAAALRRAGLEVRIHGLGDPDAAPQGTATVAAPRSGKLVRLGRALVWPLLARGDVIMTIDPDTSFSAWLSARLRRRKWVADVHEDYEALLKDRAWVPPILLRPLQWLARMMNRLIAGADLVLVADDHVPPTRTTRRYVMRNEPDFSLLPPLAAPTDGPWRAVYIGDTRTSRGLRTMVEAVAATADDSDPWHLDIVGPVAAADQPWVALRTGLPDCRHIRFHGRQEPRRAWEIAAGADVGLCLLEITPAFADAMPSKVYEYLACGMPTIATPLPRVAEVIHRTGAGAIVAGARETTDVLRRFIADGDWRADLRAAALEAGEVARTRRNTYDEAARRVSSLVAGRD